MSTDVIAKIDGYITPSAVLKLIQSKFDQSAALQNVQIQKISKLSELKKKIHIFHVYGAETEYWTTETGFICFTYNKNKYTMFYLHNNINTHENMEYYEKHRLADMCDAHTTTLILGKCGESSEIMKRICEYFGGWLDEDDEDNKPFYRINAAVKAKL